MQKFQTPYGELAKEYALYVQVMVKGNPEDNGLYSRNTSNVLWVIWTAC